MISVERQNEVLPSAHSLLLVYHNTQTNDKMSEDIALVRYFKKTPLIDNVDRI